MIKDRRGFSTRWFAQMVVQIAVVVVMILGGFWKIQDSINDSINNATLAAAGAIAVAEAAVKNAATHKTDINVHMPMEKKIEMFVPRREVEATLKAINNNLTMIRDEIIGLRQEMYRANGKDGQ